MLPILLHWNDVIIYSYPLIMGMAWGLSYRLTEYQLERDKLATRGINIVFISGFISSWFGAKLLFLIAGNSGEFTKYALNSSFWLGGGFVFYGGLIFATLTILLLCYSKLRVFPPSQLKYLLPGLAFGHSLGRLGCLLAGCCFGTISNGPFSIHLHDATRHPVQFYESILLFLIGLYLWKLIKKQQDPYRIILTYFFTYSIARFFLEFIRGDKIRGHIMGVISTGQLISLCIFALAIFLLFMRQRRQGYQA